VYTPKYGLSRMSVFYRFSFWCHNSSMAVWMTSRAPTSLTKCHLITTKLRMSHTNKNKQLLFLTTTLIMFYKCSCLSYTPNTSSNKPLPQNAIISLQWFSSFSLYISNLIFHINMHKPTLVILIISRKNIYIKEF
jgi:hypothetical protein